VYEMPDPRARADRRAWIDNRAWMNGEVRHRQYSSGSATRF
jgi:hypothetical protein